MIREWIKRVAMAAYDEHACRTYNQPSEGVRNQPIVGSPLVTVHKLSNGYLLVASSNSPYLSDGQTLVFCEDIGSIGAQIIAMEARVRMGVPSNVKISAGGGGGGFVGGAVISNGQQRNLVAASQQQHSP
jgi:hypothetical protein